MAKTDETNPQNKSPKRGEGRPSIYSEELAEEFCALLYESEGDELPLSVRQACKLEGMPSRTTIHRWLSEKPEFKTQYARARELRKDALLDRIFQLSREAITKATGAPGTGEAGARVQAIKLEIDSLKWILSKEYRHDYGNNSSTEITGANGGPIETKSHGRTPEEEQEMKDKAAKMATVKAMRDQMQGDE